MLRATCCRTTLLWLMFHILQEAGGLSREFFFGGDVERNLTGTPGFHPYRMGIRGFGAGHPLPDGCKCHKDPVQSDEVVCVCRGAGVKDLKANITKGVTRLSLESVSITKMTSDMLQTHKDSLRDLILDRVKELDGIEDEAFYGLNHLRTISIKQASGLKKIQDAVFSCHLPNLKIIRIIQSGLEEIPNLQFIETKSIIYMVDLDSNKIRELPTGAVRMKTEMLNLDFNLIDRIENKAFFGSEIAKLSLKGNTQLRWIHEGAFLGLKNIRSLDLSETSISTLPTKGLEELEVLKLTDVYPLKVFPSVYHFKYIKSAFLTYPYHCCAFKFPATHDPEEFSRYVAFREDIQKKYCNADKGTTTPMSVFRPTDGHKKTQEFLTAKDWPPWVANDVHLMLEDIQVNSDASTEPSVLKRKHNRRHLKEHRRLKDVEVVQSRGLKRFASKRVFRRRAEWGGIPNNQNSIFFQDYWYNISDSEDFFGNHLQLKRRKPSISKNVPDNPFEGVFHGTTVAVISEVELEAFCGQLSKNYRDVECFPNPDPFNPCEDVMGNMLLRVAVWIVVVTSIMGNASVMVVLMSGGACSSVSKFLMCNLAFADFCMGVYLLMIAAMDLHSIGTYFNYAIDWQHGYGCQVAGFLTVFATELSIYTLTVISVERWYAITYAINLNKRLKLRRAAKIMMAGWIFALTMAFIPLVNVNGFSRTSICLPMKNQHLKDVVYLLVLLVTNSMAFVFIFLCYGHMYTSVIRKTDIRRSAAANDMAVAKRMAMLVMTDFLCWAPIAFFAVTAVSGHPLISVTHSKILLVFFYPLNSCANPFLYAIFTTQYRRDFLSLLNRCAYCREWTRGKKSSCNVPPVQFSSQSSRRYCKQTNSYSSQVSTDNSMRVLRPSDLSSQQDVFSSSGWEDQDLEDVIHLWSNAFPRKESVSSEDSGQGCKNYSTSSHSSVTHKGSPHPVKHRFVNVDMPKLISTDFPIVRTTVM